MKKLFVVLLSVMMLALTFGCSEKLQEITQGSFSIKLPTDVVVSDDEDVSNYYYTYLYNDDFALTVNEDEFDVFTELDVDPTTLDEEGYGNLLLSLYEMEGSFSQDSNGHYYFTYESTVEDVDYYYYLTVRKGEDSFWLMDFITYSENKDTLSKSFEKWSNTITIE